MRRVVMLSLAIVVAALASGVGPVVHGQGLIPGSPCSIDGQSDLFPRYEWRNQRVTLVSWSTGEVVRVVETSLDAPYFEALNRSPDCRFLVAEVGGQGTVVWDVLTSTRAAVLPTLDSADLWPTDGTRFVWSPTGKYVLLRDSSGQTQIWDTMHETLIPLVVQSGPFVSVGWDLAREQVLAVPATARNTVIAYDLRTGGQVAVFYTASSATNLRWIISQDGSRIVLYGSVWGGEPPFGLSVWQRDTMEAWHLNAGVLASSAAPRVALSADNRYLAMARANNVRVWDLARLPASIEARVPFFEYGCAWNECHDFIDVRFPGSGILEVVEDRSYVVRRWDLTTGLEITGS